MPLVRLPDGGGHSILVMQCAENIYVAPDMDEEALSKVHNIPLRSEDIILCSYPKSGCHWLWEMIRMLLAKSTDVEHFEKEKCMMEFASHDVLSAVSSPRVLNTHFLFEQLPPPAQSGQHKLVFVYRNPKDVAVSFYNHHFKFPEYEYKGSFSDYLHLFYNGHLDFGSFFAYMRDWEAVISSNPQLPILILSYEDMQESPLENAQRMAHFLEVELDDALMKSIVEKCSFSNMQERKGKEWTTLYGEPVMYRKGKVGDWRNWFTVAQSDMFDAVCEKELAGSRFHFRYTL